MKSTGWFGALGLTLLAASCDPALSLEEAKAGKRCGVTGSACLDGYECNLDNICVQKMSNAGTSGAGSGGDAGESVADAGGAGGSESIEAGMDTMSSDVPDAADAAANCTPALLFQDLDRDGFGSGEAVLTCPAEGWVVEGGDCFDAEPTTSDNLAAQVHPRQTGYFAVGYPVPGQPGQISFDYNCSEAEEPDPANRAGGRRGSDCASASPTNCGLAAGFTTDGRAGAGIDDRCGGHFVLCDQPNANECTGNPQLNDLFRCH